MSKGFRTGEWRRGPVGEEILRVWVEDGDEDWVDLMVERDPVRPSISWWEIYAVGEGVQEMNLSMSELFGMACAESLWAPRIPPWRDTDE